MACDRRCANCGDFHGCEWRYMRTARTCQSFWHRVNYYTKLSIKLNNNLYAGYAASWYPRSKEV